MTFDEPEKKQIVIAITEINSIKEDIKEIRESHLRLENHTYDFLNRMDSNLGDIKKMILGNGNPGIVGRLTKLENVNKFTIAIIVFALTLGIPVAFSYVQNIKQQNPAVVSENLNK